MSQDSRLPFTFITRGEFMVAAIVLPALNKLWESTIGCLWSRCLELTEAMNIRQFLVVGMGVCLAIGSSMR
uniref:Uncharacterized protein n=1 Tax=Talaromyces marneffei PM1 TaxID=1077442 RepID=A0A093W1P5_TALMA